MARKAAVVLDVGVNNKVVSLVLLLLLDAGVALEERKGAWGERSVIGARADSPFASGISMEGRDLVAPDMDMTGPGYGQRELQK